ncbi:MAG: metallophosphoesterase [Methylobacillus sp.]|nr:metallophosphoesterase [Methylobacillus sp.]
MARTLKISFLAMMAFVLAAAAGLYFYTHPSIPRVPPDIAAADNITFYALGDQGSSINQWWVARAMEKQAEKDGDPDFVALLGDNFYNVKPLTLDSASWKWNFEYVYSGKYLNSMPFYAILGNHDPESVDGKNVEIEYARRHLGSGRWRMPADYYAMDFGNVGGRPLIRMVFLNTNLSMDDLKKEADFIRDNFPNDDHSPIWKIVAGHHPMHSYGKYKHPEEAAEFSERAGIIAAALMDAHVDLYLSGHDHNQQLIARGNEPVYVINGAGGAETYEMRGKSPDLKFARSDYGFARVYADAKSLEVNFFDTQPHLLSSFVLLRACVDRPSACLKAVRR